MEAWLLIRLLLLVLILLLAGPVGTAQQSSSASPPTSTIQQPLQGAPVLTAPTIPHFDDSPHGLESMISKMFGLAKTGDAEGLKPYLQSLELPDPGTWFTRVFGDQVGAAFSREYEQIRPQVPAMLSNAFAGLLRSGLTKPVAVELKNACDPRATAPQYSLLLARKTNERLYVIRFVHDKTLTDVPFFAYADGSFRYIGNVKMDTLSPETRGGPQTTLEELEKFPNQVRVGGNVMAAQLLCHPFPYYPEKAKQEGVQGKVVLHAIVDRDGFIKDLHLVSGDPMLAQSAFETVRQWRYRPTVLYGRPIEVDTSITVVFTLGHE
jgi:TonB family protein